MSLLLIAQQGCGGLELNPIISERRVIHTEQDSSKTLSVSREVVFDDKRHPAHRIRLPAGAYSLEGEDADYWYFRSAMLLQMVDYHRGSAGDTQGGDKHSLRGGVALGKYSTRSVPAAVYIDGEGGAKLLIWKLGRDFMSGEGRDWRRSF